MLFVTHVVVDDVMDIVAVHAVAALQIVVAAADVVYDDLHFEYDVVRHDHLYSDWTYLELVIQCLHSHCYC